VFHILGMFCQIINQMCIYLQTVETVYLYVFCYDDDDDDDDDDNTNFCFWT
jgi:hypothetical protein